VVKDDKKDTYQDCVTAPLNREHNDDVGGDTEGFEDDAAAESLGEVLTAIPKVSLVSFVIDQCLYVFSSGISFELCVQVLSDGRHG